MAVFARYFSVMKNNVKVLHASTGLITAEYKNNDSGWRLIHDFLGPTNPNGKQYGRGKIRQTKEYSNANLKQYGWVANLIDKGPANETEYKVALSDYIIDNLFMAVSFFQVKAETKIAKLPADLSGGAIDRELIAGSARNGLHFAPNSWIKLELQIKI
jgi:hypothetical protein